MELNRKNMTKIFFLAAVIILFYLCFKHMDVVFGFLGWVFNVLTPFLIAGCIIFLLNVPLKAIERHLFRPKNGKPVSKFKEKARRPIAITLSIAIFFAIIAAFLMIIIPEIAKSLSAIAEKIPSWIEVIKEWFNELSKRDDIIGETVRNIDIDWNEVGKIATDFLQNNSVSLVGSAIGFITSVLQFALNFFLGFVLAVYVLAKKEKIASDCKKLIYSILPMKKADFICELGSLTNKSFYNSITGQMIECLIIGSLTALGMTIMGFPYAALGGVVVAIMSWIPMFGIYIGTGIVGVLLLTNDPMQTLWFVIYMIILQQIEGNLIFPRVVGSKIGLPPIILISAIILFSNFFGIIGLLVCGPVTFVIYTMLRRFVYKRIEQRKIPKHKYEIVTDPFEKDDEIDKIQHELDKQIHAAEAASEEAERSEETADSKTDEMPLETEDDPEKQSSDNEPEYEKNIRTKTI